jgi:hypothetical protein
MARQGQAALAALRLMTRLSFSAGTTASSSERSLKVMNSHPRHRVGKMRKVMCALGHWRTLCKVRFSDCSRRSQSCPPTKFNSTKKATSGHPHSTRGNNF